MIQSAAGGLLVASTLALSLLVQVVSVVYGGPLSAGRVARGRIARHPWIVLLIGFLLFVSTSVPQDAFIAVRSPQSPALLRVLAMTAVVISALPFTFVLFHLGPLREVSRGLRPSRAERAGRLGRAWTRLGGALRSLPGQLRELGEGVRNLRTLFGRG